MLKRVNCDKRGQYWTFYWRKPRRGRNQNVKNQSDHNGRVATQGEGKLGQEAVKKWVLFSTTRFCGAAFTAESVRIICGFVSFSGDSVP
jgi:hypothetical protein